MLAQWSMRGKIETLMNMVKSLFLAGLLAFAPGSVSAQDVAPAPQTATAAPAGAATDSAPAAAASVPALKPVEGIGMPRPGEVTFQEKITDNQASDGWRHAGVLILRISTGMQSS